MATGTVKWFNNAKGFGFICPDGGGEDIFAHHSVVEMEGYRTLKAGQVVNYELQSGPKGGLAEKVTIVQENPLAESSVTTSAVEKETISAQ